MSTSVFHRRRAERFAQLLDEAGGGRRHHVRSRGDEDLAPLVAMGHRVQLLEPKVEINPNFRTGLRAMLLATAEREGIGVTAVDANAAARPTGRGLLTAAPGRRLSEVSARRARARGAVIVGIAAGTLALSGMSAASGDAVPGDALYGIKRSTERAQLALASSDMSRGQLYLEFAKTRVGEARAVSGDGTGVTGVLDDMDAETLQGVRLLTSAAVNRRDPSALDAIDRFVEAQRRTVAGLLNKGAAARPRVLDSLNLLDSVTQRSRDLRTSLTCGVVGNDHLGPVPNTCGATSGPRPPHAGTQPTGSPAGPQVPEASAPADGTAGAGQSPASGRRDPVTAGGNGGPAHDRGPVLGDLLG